MFAQVSGRGLSPGVTIHYSPPYQGQLRGEIFSLEKFMQQESLGVILTLDSLILNTHKRNWITKGCKMEDNIKVQNKEKYFLIKIKFFIVGSIRGVE